jgi:outer membrane protein assembly factor BamB
LAAYDVAVGEQLWSFPLESDGDAVAGAVFDGERAYLWKSPGVVVALTLSKLPTAARSGRFDEAVAWQRRLPAAPNCASPVLCGGMLFVVSDLGVASCLDASTGELLRRHRVEGPCMASPSAAGGRVYIPSNSGTVTVLSADAKFQVVAENDLDERLYASPALVDGQMILRGEAHVFCIDDRAPPTGPIPARTRQTASGLPPAASPASVR